VNTPQYAAQAQANPQESRRPGLIEAMGEHGKMKLIAVSQDRSLRIDTFYQDSVNVFILTSDEAYGQSQHNR
jgi:hypothetical protein